MGSCSLFHILQRILFILKFPIHVCKYYSYLGPLDIFICWIWTVNLSLSVFGVNHAFLQSSLSFKCHTTKRGTRTHTHTHARTHTHRYHSYWV